MYLGALTTPTASTPPGSASLRETLEGTLGPEIAGALAKKGFERLTPVQEAMLLPEHQGRDLRISSQTGSGKTVAIGLAIREHVRPVDEDDDEPAPEGGRAPAARPRALVVTPTRELARQVEEELTWLFAPLGLRLVCVTGGSGYRDELRALRREPAIVVGTPGRLLDHLKRGSIDAGRASAVVLDEADRMLDLGFRDDLEAILGFAPENRRTHLVSATFPREVKALADRVQTDPAIVEGTPLGRANLDIEHLVHLLEPRDRLAAIVNLLLETPGAQTLVFARTRADVAELAETLSDAGFGIAMLSGEMEQAERNRALAAFKRGNVDALVATDVAARGIDVQDVARVLHAQPPDDSDAYTHRSGRTGRAGKKGISSILATRSELGKVTGLLRRARVSFRFAPVPTAASIQQARDERLVAELTADPAEGEAIDPEATRVAERILGSGEPVRAVARLIALVHRRAQAEPREITPVAAPDAGPEKTRRGRSDDRPRADGWVPFRVSWGEAHGADARRLVAMMCRRGNVEGRHLGGIRVGRTSSVVEVAADVAADFERAASKPDPRDPRVQVRRWSEEPLSRKDGGKRPARPASASKAGSARPKRRPSG